jgi:hypothetical protein
LASIARPAADRFERARLRPEILEIRLRERELGLAFVRLASPDEHEAIAVGKRQRVEHDPVQNREHRGHPADADGKGQHRDDRESSGVSQTARSVTKVLDHAVRRSESHAIVGVRPWMRERGQA